MKRAGRPARAGYNATMPDSLDRLWRLHKIDQAVFEIRARAAALDPGKRLSEEIADAQRELDEAQAEVHALSGQASDLELAQKGIDEKIKRFDKELYGGGVVNPREVEALQKEVVLLKKERGDLDVRILELWDRIPEAKEAAQAAEEVLKTKKAELAEHRKTVLESKEKLESAFKEATARRAPALEGLEPAMIARYDAIRQKHGGLAMSKVLKDGSCELCGTMQPRKSIEAAKEGRIATCESCHRILYWSDGLA